jgi:hypothetical protein
MRFLAFHIDFSLRQAALARHTHSPSSYNKTSADNKTSDGNTTSGINKTPGAGPPDKLSILIKLNDFSLFNAPPLAQAKETLDVLMNHYPETMGHCVVYRPPRVFSGLWAFAQNIIDVRGQHFRAL